MKLFITFLSLDLITKKVAEVLAPKSNFFYLMYNKNLVFDINLGFTSKFLVPLMLLPIMYYSLKLAESKMLINPAQRNLISSLGMAGIIGNYSGRFNDSGVVDFLNFQFCVANFADVYQWVAYGLLLYYVSKNAQLLKSK